MTLKLYNSLTRGLETFQPIHEGEARVYTCGPTVYNYQHIGNMRAFIFADTLGRVLKWHGYDLTHIINITDVGHLTSDADAGEDKMERAAAQQAKSIWDIAAHYTDAFKRDVRRLNITQPAEWTVATDYVPQMIEFAKAIEGDCYQLDTGLYFDTSKVPNYGSLARAVSDEGESRIDPVDGKRNAADFAIWRTSPPGEQRQMEWDSPWGKGAPGWHLECSVMSHARLGHPFDIHTGGIDHREIHHPNEIAQNQAFCACDDPGARIWMHNNFLVDRGGKMSKSAGGFLTLQTLVDAGVHPLAYRLLCLQAHYRSELEFTWDNLAAALTRLKRLVQAVEKLRERHDAEPRGTLDVTEVAAAREAVGDDLNTARVLVLLETVVSGKGHAADRLLAARKIDRVLGLRLAMITRDELRVRPKDATIDEDAIEARLDERKAARVAKDFARSDAIRDELAAAGVEVMDGDPLAWEWKLDL
ncbi:cysteine--tRNA ligase [Sphingomonas donggukensis]|uniref:Cysteine--tRNA ligase n=1 Tax=Sphingomonas donggukensis TaxID=2949093 RepID=A0ABY4TZY1_9SPHN|nr:cysteine--tRNA ligase [Sphingomonas donggukensis]URW76684.1 cysteine--tRNA ligase [Sphingomonas donggukensis]